VLLNRGVQASKMLRQAAGVTDRLDGRSVAMADLFNRGVLDVVIANERGSALLYKNESSPGHWLELKLIGTRSNRSAIGAEVTVELGAARQAPGRRWRDGILQPKRSPAAFRTGEQSPRPCDDPLAVRHRAGLERPDDRSAACDYRARALKPLDPRYLIVFSHHPGAGGG